MSATVTPAYRGQIYWHGIFPRFDLTGRIVKRGTMRHEVQWDHRPAGQTSLEHASALQLVSQQARCCPFCTSVREQAAAAPVGAA